MISEEDSETIVNFFEAFNLPCEQINVTDFKIKVYKRNDGEIIVDIDDSYNPTY